ncbi:MAG: putative pre6S rRNA nuclease [Acidimicrobiaceae bacterium]
MRALGLDLGARRIGVAISDSEGKVATAIATLERASAKNRVADHQAIAGLVAEWEAGVVAVGLPLSLDGSVGPAAEGVLAEVAELARVLDVPVETVDERFTTVTADQQLKASGVRGRDRPKLIDQVAAAVLLQAWLDRQESERR